MVNEFLLPQLGQSVESCIIVEWRKKEEDRVKKGDVLCEVETDKATLEVESTLEGTLVKILHEEGDDVPVLTPIALIEDEKSAVKTPPASQPAESTAQPAASSTKAPVASPGVSETIQTVPPPAEELPSEELPSKELSSEKLPSAPHIRISPRAKKLAEKNGIGVSNYEKIKGSGPGGRILEQDIKDYLNSSAYKETAGQFSREQPIQAQSAGTEKSTPLSGIRKVIAKKMLQSITGSAQYTITASANAEKILGYRERLKKLDSESPLAQITINDIVLFTTTRVLTNFKNINSLIVNSEVVEKSSVNLGFAVDTPRGLLVPVIRNADKLSLKQISNEAKRLKDACINGTIQPDEFAGGTFTVTNLGYFGIESFTPIINPPQVGVLGVCSIQPKPVFDTSETLSGAYSGQVHYIPALKLSLTLDHRIIDGAPGARFLQALCRAFEDFDLLLAG